MYYIDGLAQDCSNSSALAMELLQSCTKPSTRLPMNQFTKKTNRIFAELSLNFNVSSGCSAELVLSHWGRVMHICISKLTTIGSDTDLAPTRRQAIIWTNGGILLLWPLHALGTKFSEIFIKIHTFSFKKTHLKMSSAKWQQRFLSLNVLTSFVKLATYDHPLSPLLFHVLSPLLFHVLSPWLDPKCIW